MTSLFDTFAALFGAMLALGALTLLVALVVAYFTDIHQDRHAIRRNFPVIGRARYWLEHLGAFLRQYVVSLDREEQPFNRAQRSWVYRAAKNIDNTVAFGSTKQLTTPGSMMFLNTAYPSNSQEAVPADTLVIGPQCEQPFQARHFFNISAMSYGALSRPAVTALSHGAARAGCWLNTGEGGLTPFHLESGCDVIMQIGTAKYGVRDGEGHLSDERLRTVAAHEQVRAFELKLSQGAKPGKGGILPAEKVSEEIAAIRGIPAGEASISPNRHPEIRNSGDLLDMVGHIRDVTGKPCGIKFVLGEPHWFVDLCAEINRRGAASAPDFVTVDSADGGTGAAPMPLMDDVGLLLRESLPYVVDTLVEAGLRERVRVVASGKLITPADVAYALCMGADFCNTARGFMFALGCVQAMQCNRNTCPTGVTTHDIRLQRGLVVQDKAERVFHYHHNLTHEVEVLAHSCGLEDPREFQRHHVRVMTDSGKSLPLAVIYPDAQPVRIRDSA